ncbi:MAG: DUF4199 family protein [Ignavibacteriae bacterium]|nr:MAG: DUF4199 family protein [Ignavibacteriota bacterium]
METPSKFTPVIISTAIISAISLFPLLNLINLFCCAGVMLGVFAGCAYYNNKLKQSGEIIQYKDGTAIGLLSGLVSALIIVIVTALLSMITNQNPIPDFYKMIDNYGLTIPKELEDFLQKISEEYRKNGFSITLTLISLVTNIIIYPLFGVLGGLLSVSILGRRKNAEQ